MPKAVPCLLIEKDNVGQEKLASPDCLNICEELDSLSLPASRIDKPNWLLERVGVQHT